MAANQKYKLEISQRVRVNLANPYPNLYFKAEVISEGSVDLSTTFQIQVKLTSLKRNLPCIVELSDRNLENMLIINKNAVLCDFDKFRSSTAEVFFEILPLKTGYIRIPEITLRQVDGR